LFWSDERGGAFPRLNFFLLAIGRAAPGVDYLFITLAARLNFLFVGLAIRLAARNLTSSASLP
jgi:hypothetical protein